MDQTAYFEQMRQKRRSEILETALPDDTGSRAFFILYAGIGTDAGCIYGHIV